MTLETVAMAAVVTLGVVVLVVSLRNELAEQREHRERMRPVLPPDRPVIPPGDPYDRDDDYDDEGLVPEVAYGVAPRTGLEAAIELPGTQFVVDQEARRMVEKLRVDTGLLWENQQEHITSEIRSVNQRFNQLNDTLRGRGTLNAEVSSLNSQMRAMTLDLLELRDAVRELGGPRQFEGMLGETVAPHTEGEVNA
jgi:hypothetical protein